MNAEVLSMVDFIRAKELVVGQEFLYFGIWHKVHIIDDEGIYYRHNKSKGKIKSKSSLERFGLNNQMFVQVAK